MEDNKLEVQQLGMELEGFQSDHDIMKKNLAQLEKNKPWILDQKHLFGTEGSTYDFSKVDIPEMGKRIKQLKTRHDSLSRTVDRNAIEMFDRYLASNFSF